MDPNVSDSCPAESKTKAMHSRLCRNYTLLAHFHPRLAGGHKTQLVQSFRYTFLCLQQQFPACK